MTSRSTDNRAVGTLDDGRVVWLHYHLVGRLPGDLLSESSSPSLMALIPGGYLEAVGGRIYELGEPSHAGDSKEANDNTLRHGLWEDTDSSQDHAFARSSHQSHNDPAWWFPATTGTVSGLLASTVLSACIGYGAGLGIIADTTGPHHAAATTTTQQPLNTIPTVLNHRNTADDSNSVHMIHYKSSSYNTPSLEESMARAEYKVLREERLLKKIAEELEKDQADLKGLQQIQLMEQQARGSQFLP